MGIICGKVYMYRVIHNSLTHFPKLVHLNGGKDFNMRLTYRRETLQVYLYMPQAFSLIRGCQEQFWVKMAVSGAEVFCMLVYAWTQSIVAVQRIYRTKFGKDPPVRNSIMQWYDKFQSDRCLCITKRPGWPGPTKEWVEHVRKDFQCSPNKTTNRASQEECIPQPILWRQSPLFAFPYQNAAALGSRPFHWKVYF